MVWADQEKARTGHVPNLRECVHTLAELLLTCVAMPGITPPGRGRPRKRQQVDPALARTCSVLSTYSEQQLLRGS